MNIKKILLIFIVILLIFVLFYGMIWIPQKLFNEPVDNFCKERGFDFAEFTDSVYGYNHCCKIINEEMVCKYIKLK